MSGSPSKASQRDGKPPGMPARKRHVQATNAWAQEQAMEVEDDVNMVSLDNQLAQAIHTHVFIKH